MREVIILGGGLAGLLAAKVCATYFQKVTIIERYPEQDKLVRRGIPQANHLHVLMKKGQEIIHNLFPGILEELKEQGAHGIDWANDTCWQGPFGLYPRYHSKTKTLLFSRALLDKLLYKTLKSSHNVMILAASVEELIIEESKISRVIIQNNHTQQIQELKADLIIDARGRGSNISQILEKNQTSSVPTITVENKLSYLSAWFKNTSSLSPDFKQCYVQVRAGIRDLGFVISPIENKQYTVTFIAWDKKINPPQQAELIKMIKEINLFNEPLEQFFTSAELVNDYHSFRHLHNKRYLFSKTKAWPNNLLVIGDAMCVLNPVYGQGMTVAAKQVLLLQNYLEQVSHSKKKLNNIFHLQKKIERSLFVPWLLATTEDMRGKGKKELPFAVRLLHYFLDKVLLAATTDHFVHKKFLEVLHMTHSPISLLSPRVLGKIFMTNNHKRK